MIVYNMDCSNQFKFMSMFMFLFAALRAWIRIQGVQWEPQLKRKKDKGEAKIDATLQGRRGAGVSSGLQSKGSEKPKQTEHFWDVGN